MDLRYTYDADNRIIEKYEQSWMTNYQPEVTYYQYDPAGRLTEVQYPWGITESYQYDPAGNRIILNNSATGVTYYTYDKENKLLYANHSGNLTYYDYDNTGNTISATSPDGNTTYYTYDYERRLISVTLPNNINITYAYLPNGDRIMRSNETETIYHLYDREDRIGDYDINGNLIQSYTHGIGIDEPVALTIDGSTYFYIPDIQGSIRAIVDTQGNAVATYQYDAWGTLVSYNGPLAEKNDYLYTSREYDWQSGIYYYRYRYYNPEIGRFLQSSWELNKEMNMYVYVGNDPVNEVDPTGHPESSPPVQNPGGGGGNNNYAPGSCWSYCVECCKYYHNGLYIITGNRCVAECQQRCAGTWCGTPSEWKWLKCYPRPTHATCGLTDRRITHSTPGYTWENFDYISAWGSFLMAPFTPSYRGGLGIRLMEFNPQPGMPIPPLKPTPLPIAPIGSPFWRMII